MPPGRSSRTNGGNNNSSSSKRTSSTTARHESSSSPPDLCHTRDSPCCRLLHDVASELCSSSNNKTTLSSILWFLLKQQREQELAIELTPTDTATAPSTPPRPELDAIATAAARKKKRKKKKKKPRADNAGETNDVEEEEVAAAAEEFVVNGTELAQEAMAPPYVVADAPPLKIMPLEAPSAPLQSRSRRIRHAHFDQFVDHLLAARDEQQDASSSSSSLMEQLPLLQAQLPSLYISHADLLKSLDSISCERCRDYMTQFVAHHAHVRLGPKPPISFDYVAMEEGMLPNGDTHNTTGLSFARMEPENGNVGETYWKLSSGAEQSDTLQTILDLAQDYVFACGFGQDERLLMMGYNVIELSSQRIDSIKQTANSRSRDWNAHRFDILNKLEEQTSKWYDTKDHDAQSIEVFAFSVLLDIDGHLDALAEKIWLYLIQPLVDAFCAAATPFSVRGGHLEQEHELELKRYIQELWRAFMDYIYSCIEQVAKYEGLIFPLADRHENLPSGVLNPLMRDFCRELVRMKVFNLHTLIDTVDKISQAEVETGILDISSRPMTTLRNKLYTRHAFCNVVDQKDSVQLPPTLEQTDQAWSVFIQDLFRCAKTIHKKKAVEIHQEHDRNRERLQFSLQTAISTLEEACIGCQDDWALNDYSEAEDEPPPRVSVLRFVETMSGLHPLESFRSKFKVGAVMSANVWTDLRSCCRPVSKNETASAPLQMPSNLIRTMSHDGEDALSSCHPGKEDHRACSVMVGLYFRQLAALCDEWRANVAELELLTSITTDSNLDAQSGDIAKSKKKSKKKNKKASTVPLETSTAENGTNGDSQKLRSNDGYLPTAVSLTTGPNQATTLVQTKPAKGDPSVKESALPSSVIASSPSIGTNKQVNNLPAEKTKTAKTRNEACAGLLEPPLSSSSSSAAAAKQPAIVKNENDTRKSRQRKPKLSDGNRRLKETIPTASQTDVNEGGLFCSMQEVDGKIRLFNEHDQLETAQDFLIGRLMLALQSVD